MKLQYDEPLSNFAFDFYLRRYIWDKSRGKWRAKWRDTYLGHHATEEAAARAYTKYVEDGVVVGTRAKVCKLSHLLDAGLIIPGANVLSHCYNGTTVFADLLPSGGRTLQTMLATPSNASQFVFTE